ncbi:MULTISPECIES: winged helix-turn-helix domain-containing protein [unclassified Bradyrhizobium]|uniref:winged helix-turn-helix domain-containing protein n=1 Tax=unclassified Bradyrhizobium TaxID=2631580 RepID=UPI0029168513|nr:MULTISPECIES: winged helix-turn-helix domain-containing protein [unclassified Bradyrhizobium]
MVLDIPGGDVVGWFAALIDAGPRGIVRRDDLAFARDRREIVVEGHAIGLTPLEAQVLSELIDHAPAVVRRDDLIERVWRRAHVAATLSTRWCGRCARSRVRNGIAFRPSPRPGIVMSDPIHHPNRAGQTHTPANCGHDE